MKNSNNCKVLGRIDTATLNERIEASKAQRKAHANAKRKRATEAKFRAGNNPFQALVIR